MNPDFVTWMVWPFGPFIGIGIMLVLGWIAGKAGWGD